MKKLLTLLLLSAGLTAHAQTTNIVMSVLIEEGSIRTNTLSATLTADHVLGLNLAWAQNIAANGTNAPSFRVFVRQEITDRLASLKQDALTYQMKTTKVDQIVTSINLNWQNASAAQKKLLTDWLAAFPPP